MAGAAAAWGLRGARVVVLERSHRIGSYASGRNAGILRAVVADPIWAAWCARAMLVMRQSELGGLFAPIGCWLTADAGGHAEAAPPAGLPAALGALAARAATHGGDVAEVEIGQIAAAWQIAPARIAGLAPTALLVRSDGVVDPPRLLQALIDGALGRGAELALGCAVTSLRPESWRGIAGWRITTSQGAWWARVVVNAAGAWCDELVAAADLPPIGLVPMKRHIMRVGAPTGATALAVPAPVSAARSRPVWWHLGAAEHYIRATDDGGFVASTCDARATHADDYEEDDGVAAAHRAHLANWFPWLAAAEVSTQGCLRTFLPSAALTATDVPFVRELAPGYVAVCGLGGHGATIAAAVGQAAAARIAAAL